MGGYQRGGPNNETEIDDSVTDASTAELTKSILVGEDDNGDYNNITSFKERLDVESRDSDTYNVLRSMLVTLKKIEIHMQAMTSERITDMDTEV